MKISSFTINNLIQGFKPVIDNTIKENETKAHFLNHFQIKETLVYNEDKDTFLKNAINLIYNKIAKDFAPSRKDTKHNIKTMINCLFTNRAKELRQENKIKTI